MRAYVGVTDWGWYRFLQGRGATEVNFWQPSGGRRFGAIPEGAPFLFKSHYSHGNRIVGGGFLSGWASLPMTRAWEFFGEDNGCATFEEMRTQIRKYRNKTLDDGCADLGQPRLTPVRVGQAAFKALVQEAYGRRCAVTSDKIVPVLQAAHIRPVTDHGENRVDNGLLLRSDVHTLFDHGYLGVHPKKKTLLVSPSLRADWGNGEDFYQRAASGEPISMPRRRLDQPNADFLTWHADTVFRAS